MSYTPTTWTTGDTISASALNKIENGIADAGSGSGATIIVDNGTALDKTFAEIYELIKDSVPCYISYTQAKSTTGLDNDYAYRVSLMPIIKVYKYDNVYRVLAVNPLMSSAGSLNYVGSPGFYTYTAINSTSYPTFYGVTSVPTQYLTSSIYRD